MSQPVISVETLGKRYFIGHQVRHDTLRDRLAHGARGLWRRAPAAVEGPAVEEFWALREVSFAIQRGEVLGIIGRNGAGKSTLLKVLSRITEPTTGRVVIRGRVASLLEVGTGFHPELTGRENIFLNGAILGMSRAEIQRKFDEIVAFAEVERFLDTPVKHYSSGMYVRLAFAVAAHLEPEILIVDEVLAVGDAQFQQKCLGKMNAVARSGRTVILVSHNMAVVQSLCQRVLLLESGRLALSTDPLAAVERYLAQGNQSAFRRSLAASARCAITAGEVQVLPAPEAAQVQVRATVQSRVPVRAAFEVRLFDAQGQIVGFGSFGTFEPDRQVEFSPGECTLTGRFSTATLANGHYSLTLKLTVPFVETLDAPEDRLGFDVENPPGPGASHRLQQAWGCGACLIDLRLGP